MTTDTYFRPHGMSQDAVEAEALLCRYPDIEQCELDQLVRTFRNLPLLDFGILAADQRLGTKLDAFYADHGDKLRPPVTGLVWAAVAPVLVGVLALMYILAS